MSTIDRRELMMAGSALTIGALLPGAAIAQTPSAAREFETDFETTMKELRSFFGNLAFEEVPARPIVTDDHSHNGGLRFDADVSSLSPGHFVIQPSARVSDIKERARGDLLPMFHVFAGQLPEGETRESQARMLLGLLTGPFGLDPAKLAFASVAEVEVLRPLLEELGYDFGEKVLIRDRQEALRMRDTSGYFFPDPLAPHFITSMGIYYRMTEEGLAGFSSYPPPLEWTEVAELTVDGISPPAIAIGLERLTLATTGRYPKWEHRLELLLEKVEEDAATPPPGIVDFTQ
ncbi:MAG: hypothetical protein GY788_28760 [bacterium]|nr:hypothetical protein [bacterium]